MKQKYPYIKFLKDNQSEDKNGEKFNVLNIEIEGATKKDNTYIMMAHIMRGNFQEDGYILKNDRQKYCEASKSTLEFAESIKSDVGICNNISQIVKNRFSSKKISYSDKCPDIYSKGDIATLTDYFKTLTTSNMSGGYYKNINYNPQTKCTLKILAVPQNFELLNRDLRRINNLVGFNNNQNYNNRMNNIIRLISSSGIKSKKNYTNLTNLTNLNLRQKIRSKKRRSCKHRNRNSQPMKKYYLKSI